jgi:hypothetical protein
MVLLVLLWGSRDFFLHHLLEEILGFLLGTLLREFLLGDLHEPGHQIDELLQHDVFGARLDRDGRCQEPKELGHLDAVRGSG